MRLRVVAATSFFSFVALAAVIYFLLEIRDFVHRVHLRASGTHQVMMARHDTLQRDACRGEKDCLCVVLIHGLADRAVTWRNLLFKEETAWVKPLRFIAINLPGSGATPLYSDPDRFTVSSLARDVADSVASSCERWVLVGNSFGGWISARIALMEPARTKGLLLLNAAGVRGSYDEIVPLYLNLNRESLRDLEVRAFHEPYRFAPSWLYDLVAFRMANMPIRSMIESQMKKDEFLDDELSRLHIPVGLFWGKSDRIIPLPFLKRFAELTPSVRFQEIVEGCGHVPQHECPDKVAESLNRVLEMTP